jgi:DNA-3-methyladenine glycosylase I
MSVIAHDDGISRCAWCGREAIYVHYHDTDWGVPEYDPRALWEKLILDGFQAGLSWITILKKRENFRTAFDGFDPEVIARYDAQKLRALMTDSGIVRNKLKVEASVSNAQAYLKIEDFSGYLWDRLDGRVIQNARRSMAEVPAQTPLAETISKDLKKRGFRFVGPTIVYAFMQACGLVNDHMVTCHRHAAVKELERKL